MNGRWGLAAGLTLIVGVTTPGCAGTGPVVRVMDGHVMVGRYIREQAYAFFLAGALAEGATGAEGKPDLEVALGHYERAARLDPGEPEIWVRMGRVRCRLDPGDPGASANIARALRIDPAYEPGAAAQAFCARLRTNGGAAVELAEDVDDDVGLMSLAEPREPGAAPLLDEERRRVEALTLVHGDRVAAWLALAQWGTSHSDAALAARGMVGVARLAPRRWRAVAESTIALAGDGHLFAAREVAAALFDAKGDGRAGGEPGPVVSVPLVARMALDAALLARDGATVRARSARAHLGLELAAGRAWAMGDAALARDLIALTARADPTNLEARLVHEGAEGRAASHLLPSPGTGWSLAPEVALPFARHVLVTEGLGAARRVLASGTGVRVPSNDPILTPLAVELAVAGALAEDALPADARVELAARSGRLPTEADLADRTLDARHRFLGYALLHPADPAATALSRRLSTAAAEDPLVAVALARLHLARGEPLLGDARTRLESAAAADPLVAAALVDLARSDGPAAALSHAKERLAALAKTPAERARVAE